MTSRKRPADRARTLCMVVHAYFPLGEPRVQREAAAARDAGFDVTVLCLRGEGEPRRATVDGVRVVRFPLRHERGGGLGRLAFEYLSFCLCACWWLSARSLRRPFEIVHFHNPPDFLVASGAMCRSRGSRLILDVHDLSSHMFAARFPGPLGRALAAALVWIELAASRLADTVITVHEPYRRELVSHGVPARKVRVVMNSVDTAVLERAATAHPYTPASPRLRVAYHGTLTSWYGADLIVAALAQLRAEGLDLEAVILGDGDAVPALRRQIAASAQGERVQLSGRYLPIEQALATVATADCGVIPNRPTQINRFALSSKLFEYVALGVPVVVARLETLAAHFGPGEVTFFEPGVASSLSWAIRWVAEHPDEARARAARAKARAESYSWSRGRETLREIYRDRLAAASRSRPPGKFPTTQDPS